MTRKTFPLVLSIFLTLTAVADAAFALDPGKKITQYSHRVWKSEHGIAQNIIRCITQTHDGYLWLGTQGGLIRFDGVRFTAFDMKNTKAIRNNFITALFEDRDSTLWIATHGGLTRLKHGRFSVLTRADGLPNDVVVSLARSRDGSIWIGNTGASLSRYNGGTLTSYGPKDGLPGDKIYAVCETRDGSVWVGTDAGLCRLSDGRWTTYSTTSGLPNNIIRTLIESRDGDLWIGTYGGGLARYAQGRFEVFRKSEGLSIAMIYSLYEDSDGSIWIGTDGSGLHRLWKGKFSKYTTKDGLPVDRVHAIHQDLEGNLWIGTDGGGLDRLQEGKITTLTARNGLSEDMVRTVCEGRDGSIWIGTHGGGLNRLNGNAITHYRSSEGPLNDVIWALLEDRKGGLWVGSFGAGVRRWKDGHVNVYSTRNGLSNDMVRVVCEDSAGVVWIGTDGGGLNRLDNGKISVLTVRDGLLGNVIRDLRCGRNGNLWIGTNAGISSFQGGVFSSFPTKEMVYSLYEDSAGTLWFGTSGGGLGRIRSGRVSAYTTDDGILDNSIFGILEDGRGNLWMGTSKGIFSVSKRQLEEYAEGAITALSCTSFDEADGMESSECNGGSQPAGWRSRDGRLWFPTVRGLVVIDPEHIRVNSVPPPVLCEQVIADGESMLPDDLLHLPPGDGRIEIHYTGLSLVAPEQVKFRYMLEGFDRQWVDAGSRRTAFYTNLRPGEYRFRVVACNNDGVWNTAGASMWLTMEPHFYEAPWFFALSILSAALGAAGLHSARTHRLRQRERELAVRVEERTSQLRQEMEERKKAEQQIAASLEEKTVLLKEIHHRVKNNLQVISSLLNIQAASIDDERTKEYFRETQSRVQSMAMIHENLYQSKNFGRIDVAVYFRSLATSILRTYRLNEAVALRVDVENATLDLTAAIPCGLIINELVTNALKYAFPPAASHPHGPPEILVKMTKNEDLHIVLTVADNGVGLPEGFDYRKASSMGMSLVNILAGQLEGTLSVQCAGGTAFTLIFPPKG